MDGGGNMFLVFEGTEKSGLFFFFFFFIYPDTGAPAEELEHKRVKRA